MRALLGALAATGAFLGTFALSAGIAWVVFACLLGAAARLAGWLALVPEVR